MLPAGKLDEVEMNVPPHPAYRPAASSVHYTTSCNAQSSAPEDGRNYRPKLVELIGIINKPLFLHLFGCLYYCISDAGHTNIKILPVLEFLLLIHYKMLENTIIVTIDILFIVPQTYHSPHPVTYGQ